MTHSSEIEVQHSDYLYRMGEATVLTCSGTDRSGDALGEYHILLPREDCQLVSRRLHLRETDLEGVVERLDDEAWSFHGEVQTWARNHLERLYWQKLEDYEQEVSSAPPLELRRGEKADLVRMALRGECRDELEAIKETTRFGDLGSYLTAALGLGVITVEQPEK